MIFRYLISTECDSKGGAASIMWGPGGPGGPFEMLKKNMGEKKIRQLLQEYEADLMYISYSITFLI